MGIGEVGLKSLIPEAQDLGSAEMFCAQGFGVDAPYGTVLCLGTVFTYLAPPSTPFAVAIPADCTLVGIALCTQGASWDGTNVLLTNGLDITLGTF